MQQFYKLYEQNIEEQKKRITEISEQMRQKIDSKKTEQTPIYFVSLDSNIAKTTIVQLNPR